jgi:hypothetical protein
MTNARNYRILAGLILLALSLLAQQKKAGDPSPAKSPSQEPASTAVEMRRQLAADVQQQLQVLHQAIKAELKQELRQGLKWSSSKNFDRNSRWRSNRS